MDERQDAKTPRKNAKKRGIEPQMDTDEHG
jgi:hypothetical protein